MINKTTFKTIRLMMAVAAIFALLLSMGCVGGKAKPVKDRKGSMKSLLGDEYYYPKNPIDNTFMGGWYSKVHGLQEPKLDVETVAEASHSKLNLDDAWSAGFGLGASSFVGPAGEFGAEGGRYDKADFQGMEIVKPASLALIDFKPGVPRVVEALRFKFAATGTDRHNKLNLGASGGTPVGTGTVSMGVGRDSNTGSESRGLVMAYKFMELNPKTYTKVASNPTDIMLGKSVRLDGVNAIVKAEFKRIDAGMGKSLSYNIAWACDEANAKSENIVAAWIVTIRFLDPGRDNIVIGFPAHPGMDGCLSFSDVVSAEIEPGTDRILRETAKVVILDAEVDDFMKPKTFSATVSVVKEGFGLKVVDPKKMARKK